jgi:hypothetical protein
VYDAPERRWFINFKYTYPVQACAFGYVAALRMLLAAGYDVDYQSECDGETTLFLEAEYFKAGAAATRKMRSILLDHGASRSFRSHLARFGREVTPEGDLAAFIAQYDAEHAAGAQVDH